MTDSHPTNYVTTLTEDRIREIVREEIAAAPDVALARLRFECLAYADAAAAAEEPDSVTFARAEQVFAFVTADPGAK